MPDITMCPGINTKTGAVCPKRKYCYRYTAIPVPFWQSYFTEAYFKGSECSHFMDNGVEVDNDTKR